MISYFRGDNPRALSASLYVSGVVDYMTSQASGVVVIAFLLIFIQVGMLGVVANICRQPKHRVFDDFVSVVPIEAESSAEEDNSEEGNTSEGLQRRRSISA